MTVWFKTEVTLASSVIVTFGLDQGNTIFCQFMYKVFFHLKRKETVEVMKANIHFKIEI